MARGMEIGEDLVGTFLRRVDDGRVEYRILGEQIAQRPRVARARPIGVPRGEAGMLVHCSFPAKKARGAPVARSGAPPVLRLAIVAADHVVGPGSAGDVALRLNWKKRG